MKSNENQPVIIGVGELCQHLPENLESAMSLVDLLEHAVVQACEDTGSANTLIPAIDTIAMVRTFADSIPRYSTPCGEVKNYPRAVARRIGADPTHAVYSVAGGSTPQNLVSEYAEKISAGEVEVVLLMGGEALATTKAAKKAQISLDWNDNTGGQLEDRGLGLDGMVDHRQKDNGMNSAPLMYGLLENARRHALGMSREEYAQEMAHLFSRFSEVAAKHESAMFPRAYSAEELLDPSDGNRMVADPYPKHLVAKDGVNQAAAVVLTSLEKAEALGISPEKMVYPVTGSNTCEHRLIERPQLDRSEAMRLAYQSALEAAGISVGAVSYMDIYSCFPIAVFSACDALGLSFDDVRGLTLTGGLPFFGGPGNSYAMHSVVNVVKRLRVEESGYALVGANSGILSKHSVGIYSRKPTRKGWRACDDFALQTKINQVALPQVDDCPGGKAVIETYSVAFKRGVPQSAHIIGRTEAGRRFLGMTDPSDQATLSAMLDEDPIGKSIYVTDIGSGNRFTIEKQRTLT